MSKKLLMIMNPVAGVKKSNKHLTEIMEMFCNADYECQLQMTKPDLGADEIVKRYAFNKDLVVCIGGDGTFNEMVSGIIKNNYTPNVGYIPSGSTNDFATGLGISQSPLTAAKDIIEGTPVVLDAGKFNDRIFTYTASFGVFTKSSYSTPRDLKNTFGYLAYVLEGAKELTSVPVIHMRAKSGDREIEGNYIFGAVCNSKRIGGGFVKFDDTSVHMNDGLLEVLLIKYPKNPVEATQTLIEIQNSKFDTPYFDFFSAKEITFSTEDEVDWTIDGEYQKGSPEIAVSNLHSRFSLILNEKISKKLLQETK
ncbi:MAG: YegS/Rv2252/BmrU family lipid kinase [Clostridia bacterium]|nr:YegS/Rv2252/BmrU family lipid kinase [Clostridia bacterium]